MKAIFISFNQAYYEMILSVMDRNNIRGFTYWDEVQGRGSKTASRIMAATPGLHSIPPYSLWWKTRR